MIVAGQRLPILIATRPVDFRCGHQALALMVQTELKLDPHSGVTVIFRSKRGDRRGQDGTARPGPGTLRGDRHNPPEIRMSQGSNGRRPGQSAGASPGRKLADRSPTGGDCRLQAFRTYAAQPAG